MNVTIRLREYAAWAIAALLAVFFVASMAGVIEGGPLDPPGPPASTGKTIDEVEPRTPITSLPITITQPGSYYVTGNLSSSSLNLDGIRVSASRVTIDLGGFTLSGTGTGRAAISADQWTTALTVRNGHLAGWDSGVRAGDAASIIDVHARGMTQSTISAGQQSAIRDCSAVQGGLAIFANRNSRMTDCASDGSTGDGISGGFSNDSPQGGSLLLRVRSTNAGAVGIRNLGILDGCVASRSFSAGIATGASLVMNCAVEANGSTGVSGDNVLVHSNTASQNGSHGFNGFDSMFIGNNSRTNGLSGTGAGIETFGIAHIEGNNVSGNPFGIRTSASFGASRATIIRNTARNNASGNFVPQPLDAIGPVVDGVSIDTTANPFANFAP